MADVFFYNHSAAEMSTGTQVPAHDGIVRTGRVEAPIGVFDSGAGGLTILSALRRELPNENFVYFGDTAHCPYGMRTDSEIAELSIQISRFLIEQGAKLIVVACNTASLAAINRLRSTFSVPFVEVVPAIKRAVQITKKGRVSVAVTYQAAQSLHLRRLIDEFADGIQVYTVGCSELVTLVEQGEIDGPVVEQAVRRALQPMLAADVDVIVLGCTHFPVLRPVIEHITGHDVQVIDNALAVARRTHSVLDTAASIHTVDPDYTAYGQLQVWCSGDPRAFDRVASKLLGYPVFTYQARLERKPSGIILGESKLPAKSRLLGS